MSEHWRDKTHGGLPAVIYDETVADPEGFVIHGRVRFRAKDTDRWLPMAWLASGHAFADGFSRPHPLDLVPTQTLETVA